MSSTRRSFLRNFAGCLAGLSLPSLQIPTLNLGDKSQKFMKKKLKEALAYGDILRKALPKQTSDFIYQYLGSGRFGGCFDQYGLMNSPHGGKEGENPSKTVLMHADHWHRGNCGMDSFLTLGYLSWKEHFTLDIEKYEQSLHLYQGVLQTKLSLQGIEITLKNYFHPYNRDLLAIEIDYKSDTTDMPPLALRAETNITTEYGDVLHGKVDLIKERCSPDLYVSRISVGMANTTLAVKIISESGSISLEAAASGVDIYFSGKEGKHLMLIGAANVKREDELLKTLDDVTNSRIYSSDAQKAWHKRWGNSYVFIPVKEYQALWARSVFGILSSLAPEVRSPGPTMGWSGNAWHVHFPQDMSYIFPVLLKLGHLDIARSIVEFYHSNIMEMQDYTKLVYKAKGTMWAWEFPIGEGSTLLRDGFPNWYQFEIHNAAYPARMAYETALTTNDEKWESEVAWPIIQESARFYASIAKQEDNGEWSIQVRPSMGQDEWGGHNAKNYLDALLSAQYTLQTAVEVAKRLNKTTSETAQWENILKDQLAFSRLVDHEKNIYSTYELTGNEEITQKQKHPVQLNSVTFLPIEKPDEYTLSAYSQRYELCEGSERNHFSGWTLAALWLATSRIGSAVEFSEELQRAISSSYVDKDWIQIFESSGFRFAPFYFPSQGLFVQAMHDALLCDYWGEIQIGLPSSEKWNGAQFVNFHTIKNTVVSGSLANGVWTTSSDPGT